jgi:hypothetical protein
VISIPDFFQVQKSTFGEQEETLNTSKKINLCVACSIIKSHEREREMFLILFSFCIFFYHISFVRNYLSQVFSGTDMQFDYNIFCVLDAF